MKLDFEVMELRTRHTFRIARQAGPVTRPSIWVRIRDGSGEEGWGEAAVTTPFYGETVETASAVLPLLAGVLESASEGDPFALERVDAAMGTAIGGNRAAKCAISAALHDLVGKRLGVPVWKLWGLDPASAPISAFTIGITDPESMGARIREAAAFPILKVKLGTERDIEILDLVRREAPGKTLFVDANTGWTVKRAFAMLPVLEEFGVSILEQPLHPDDLDGLRLLRERAAIPIVADESCRTIADIPRLVGCVDAINIKLVKCGSLREGMRMIHAARAHRLGVMLGCMVESSLGIAAATQLAPLVDYVDLDGALLLENDPFRGPGPRGDGALRFGSAPGLGVRRAFATEDAEPREFEAAE